MSLFHVHPKNPQANGFGVFLGKKDNCLGQIGFSDDPYPVLLVFEDRNQSIVISLKKLLLPTVIHIQIATISGIMLRQRILEEPPQVPILLYAIEDAFGDKNNCNNSGFIHILSSVVVIDSKGIKRRP
jgi:hypothetical protein